MMDMIYNQYLGTLRNWTFVLILSYYLFVFKRDFDPSRIIVAQIRELLSFGRGYLKKDAK